MFRDGKHVDFDLGEKEGDPILVITDLLPHLSKKQDDRKLSDGIRGEELNILLGSTPVDDKEVKEAFKLKILPFFMSSTAWLSRTLCGLSLP